MQKKFYNDISFFFQSNMYKKAGLGLNNVTGEKKKVNTMIKKQENWEAIFNNLVYKKASWQLWNQQS